MATSDRRTAVQRFSDEIERKHGKTLNTRNLLGTISRQARELQATNPEQAERLMNESLGRREFSSGNKRLLIQSLQEQGVLEGKEASTRDVIRRTQFAGLLTYASVANSALNVLSRFDLGAGSFNAKVAGRVIEFEDKQKKWNNLRRAVLLGGSAASSIKIVSNIAAGVAVAPATAAAVGLAFVSQVARIYGDNQELSAQRKRQDLDSQYHQMAYGQIATRGNR